MRSLRLSSPKGPPCTHPPTDTAAPRHARQMQLRKLRAAGDALVLTLKRFKAAKGARRVQDADAVQARWARLERALRDAQKGPAESGAAKCADLKAQKL